ncbi:hypothetical protein U0070_009282, partial [Myodes glareolus]
MEGREVAGPLALDYDTCKLGAASPSVAGHPVLRYLPSDGRVHFVHQRNCQCERVVMQGFGALHVPTVWEEKDAGAAAIICVRMDLTISFPATGCRKLTEVDDKLCMATGVAADALGEEQKGHVVQISGILTHGRVCLLLSMRHSCYRARRTGERKHRSVCGRIVDAMLSALNLVIIQQEEKDIPGLTDQLGHITDVCQNVIKEPLNKEGKKPRSKAPKIQRLKQHTKKNKEEAAEYAKPLAKTMQETKGKGQEWMPR